MRKKIKILFGENLGNRKYSFNAKINGKKVFAYTESGDNPKKQRNEDSLLVDENTGLIVVADGLGGHGSGEVASRIICQAIREAVSDGLSIEDALIEAHKTLVAKSAKEKYAQNMGATVAVAQVVGNTLFARTVGDARIYIYNKNGMLKVISRDQSLIQQQIQSKGISIERKFKEKNIVHGGIIANSKFKPSQGLLLVNKKTLISPEGRIITDQNPVDSIELEAGDVVIVSSDGVNDYLPYDDVKGKTPLNFISDAVKKGKTAKDITNKIISSIPKGQKKDNIGIIIYQNKISSKKLKKTQDL